MVDVSRTTWARGLNGICTLPSIRENGAPSVIDTQFTSGEWGGNMSMINTGRDVETEGLDFENPFSEQAYDTAREEEWPGEQFTPWMEGLDPFSETLSEDPAAALRSETQSGFAEAYSAFRDEAFDEALELLADETAEAVGISEASFEGSDSTRRGEAHLAPLGDAAESYVDRLLESLENLDLQSLSEAQLEEQLDRLDPEAYRLSPAGEEFLGGIVRKARAAARVVVSKAKAVARTVISPALRAVFTRLKGLIRPLLRRVLSIAIGRLPAPLQPAARLLAKRVMGEAESESETQFAAEGESLDEEGPVLGTASLAVDTEQIAEGFDAALAEAAALATETGGPVSEYLDGSEAGETDRYATDEWEGVPEGRELQTLTEARAALMDRLATADEGEDLAPAIEQFVPAVLAALRIGIRVVGRPRVVRFLAQYLANFIGKWTGPRLAAPLSIAIVDMGLRLATLEAESGEGEDESVNQLAPALLANTVEDTVRQLAELEEFELEDEGLLQLALSEAFESAVTANFPSTVVKEELQLAPSLEASFIPRKSRGRAPYRVLNRRPEVTVTPQLAGSIRTFGGLTLAASLKSLGITTPGRFRLHIVQVGVGASLRTISADLRRRFPALRVTAGMFHPLTPRAAAALLREPRLGARVAPAFVQSRRRVAAGQRFYILEPIGAGGKSPAPSGTLSRGRARTAPLGRAIPSQGWCVVDLRRAEVRVALHITEVEAQRISTDIRSGTAPAAALRTLATVYDGVSRSFATPDGRVRLIMETESEDEDFLRSGLAAASRKVISSLSRALRSWILPAISSWLRTKAAEFSRATANPANGVTLLITLKGVPGMKAVGDVLSGRNVISGARSILNGSAFRGNPGVDVTVRPGVVRP